MPKKKRPLRIVLTGGPGAGKSTVAELLQKELGNEGVIIPEAATLLFSVGFPRADHVGAQRNCQRAIYYLQKNMEDAHGHVTPASVIICDRGTLDGAAYWPGGTKSFLKDMRTTVREEYSRYDAVIFLETAAMGGITVQGGNNPYRFDTIEEACALDRRVRRVWQDHKNFVLIHHEASFQNKLSQSLAALFGFIRARTANG